MQLRLDFLMKLIATRAYSPPCNLMKPIATGYDTAGIRSFANTMATTQAQLAAALAPPVAKPAPSRLYHTITVRAIPCAEPQCRLTIKGEFQPSYCHKHRNNRDPITGWAYLTRAEMQIINMLREHDWTDEALEGLMARHTEAQVETLANTVAALDVGTPDPPASPTNDAPPAPPTDA